MLRSIYFKQGIEPMAKLFFIAVPSPLFLQAYIATTVYNFCYEISSSRAVQTLLEILFSCFPFPKESRPKEQIFLISFIPQEPNQESLLKIFHFPWATYLKN